MKRSPLSPVFALTTLLTAPAMAAEDEVARIVTQVDEYLTRLTTHGFVGGVFVAYEGDAVLKKAYGTVARDSAQPLTTDCVMTTGSLTKQFTGAAIGLLASRGELDIDDSIGDYLIGVPDDKQGITIRHLLTHTAGLPGGVGHDWDLKGTRDWVFDEAMARPLEWRPGEDHSYSNLGYSLLAMIIEEISGVEYERFLIDELFQPCGMHHTGMVLVDFEGMAFPTGYRGGEEAPTFVDQPRLEDGYTWNLRGNGGVLSTVDDMFRWYRAIEGHDDVFADELLCDDLCDELRRPLWGGADQGYGYGWGFSRSRRGTRMVEHDGGNGVFYADLHRYIDEDVAIFLMTSVAEYAAEEVIEAVEAIVFEHPFALPPSVVDVAPGDLAAVAGEYELDGGERLRLVERAGRLAVEVDGPRGRALLAGRVQPVDEARRRAEDRAVEVTRTWADPDGGELDHPFLRQLREEAADRISFQGPIKRVAVLPSAPDSPDIWVEIRHRDGAWWVCYGSRGDDVVVTGADERMPLGVPASDLYPAGDGRFETFGLLAGASVGVEADGDRLRFLIDPPVEARRVR